MKVLIWPATISLGLPVNASKPLGESFSTAVAIKVGEPPVPDTASVTDEVLLALINTRIGTPTRSARLAIFGMVME
ncbi:MAG TPA: hypothetical protein VMV19_17645 [Xanthobacteraceae bacterium]|nr:hypothetical protein [Xanthobacteraceae bacterium]